MKTIGQLLDEAKGGSAIAAVQISDYFRFKHGWSYKDIAAFARDRRGIDASDWEALLYEGAR